MKPEVYDLKPSERTEIVSASGVDGLLAQIRPEWQTKNLIERVKKLIKVDASSACQRLFNAVIWDLRQKIVTAGIDIAKEAASRFRLPSISKAEDITEDYNVSRVIDLAYRIGILSRPEWRRIKRCYEIRKDLEHEDDEYEAEIDDILYIFKNSVQLVLSRDPVEVLRIDDVKQLINKSSTPYVSEEILEEYEKAPNSRQREIIEHLINVSLDSKQTDIVRQNSVELLRNFNIVTSGTVKSEVGQWLQERYSHKRLDLVVAKVANAAGVFPYIKQRKRIDFFEWMWNRFKDTGYNFRSFSEHSKLFDDFDDVGGFENCTKDYYTNFVKWMTLCYLGEPGGYGDFGRNRAVFSSDAATPRIEAEFRKNGEKIKTAFERVKKDKIVGIRIRNKAILRRLERLEDYINGDE